MLLSLAQNYSWRSVIPWLICATFLELSKCRTVLEVESTFLINCINILEDWKLVVKWAGFKLCIESVTIYLCINAICLQITTLHSLNEKKFSIDSENEDILTCLNLILYPNILFSLLEFTESYQRRTIESFVHSKKSTLNTTNYDITLSYL